MCVIQIIYRCGGFIDIQHINFATSFRCHMMHTPISGYIRYHNCFLQMTFKYNHVHLSQNIVITSRYLAFMFHNY